MTRSDKRRRVLSNDDGWIVRHAEHPLTPEQMWDNMIAPHEGSPIDGFLWSIGGHDVYDFETNIGERFGGEYAELAEPGDRQKAANLGHLIENHGGPVTVISGLCRRAGMDFFPSVRMNEHYDMDVSSPGYSRLRRERPELLIGRVGDKQVEGTIEWGIRTGLDYALPEVRSYMSSIIIELLERFDVDGIELDYMRHPAFFRVDEASASRGLMTDFVRGIRRRMDELSAERGRPLDLIARVPPTLSDSARIGLDAEAWMKEGLVDILVAGGGFRAFEMPLQEFVEAADGTGCQVYGSLEALRPAVDELTLRAIAARYRDAGVDGLYLFNYYSMSNEWKRDVLGKLVDRDALARLDKRYELDKSARFTPTSQLGLSFLNAIPPAQAPVVLGATADDGGAVLRMEIADRVEDARKAGALGTCTLGLLFDDLGDGDEVEVSLNGAPLSWTDGKRSAGGWEHVTYEDGWSAYPSGTKVATEPGDGVEFQVSAAPLKYGSNEIVLRLIKRDPVRSGELVLKDARVWVRYAGDS